MPMLRETLTATIEKAAITEGYAFHTGFAYRINNGIAKFPAAWLLPVRIIAVEGRRDGYLTYQMTLYLMHLDKKPRPESREPGNGRSWRSQPYGFSTTSTQADKYSISRKSVARRLKTP